VWRRILPGGVALEFIHHLGGGPLKQDISALICKYGFLDEAMPPRCCYLYCNLLMSLSVFNRLPIEGYTQGGKFWVRRRRDQELEGARNIRFRQVRAAMCVILYVLYGGLYSFGVE
jgi:hypothetical protein